MYIKIINIGCGGVGRTVSVSDDVVVVVVVVLYGGQGDSKIFATHD